MPTFEFTADYFRQLPRRLENLICAKPAQVAQTRVFDSEINCLRLSPRFELQFKDSYKGTQVDVCEGPKSGQGTRLSLFAGAWADVDVRLAITCACAEIVLLPGGQLKIHTAQSFLERISWLDGKGISVNEVARFIELFILSLAVRPGELKLEAFSASDCFAEWKSQQLRPNGLAKSMALSDGTNRFFTLKTNETKDLLIDSLKAQTLTSWRHWSGEAHTSESGQELLYKKRVFSVESPNKAVDLENGFFVESLTGNEAELFLDELQELSGVPHKSYEVTLAQV